MSIARGRYWRRSRLGAALAVGVTLAVGVSPATASDVKCNGSSDLVRSGDSVLHKYENNMYLPSTKVRGGLEVRAWTCAVRWGDTVRSWVSINWRPGFSTRSRFKTGMTRGFETFYIQAEMNEYGDYDQSSPMTPTWRVTDPKICDVTKNINTLPTGKAQCVITLRKGPSTRGGLYASEGKLYMVHPRLGRSAIDKPLSRINFL